MFLITIAVNEDSIEGSEAIVIEDYIKDLAMIRKYKNKTYTIKNYRILSTSLKCTSLTTLKPHMSYNAASIISLDIECLTIKGKFVPYAVGLYDGKTK